MEKFLKKPFLNATLFFVAVMVLVLLDSFIYGRSVGAGTFTAVTDLQAVEYVDAYGDDRIMLNWTNPVGATQFSVVLHTGVISAETFLNTYGTWPGVFDPINDEQKKAKFNINPELAHVVGIRVKDATGNMSEFSNILLYSKGAMVAPTDLKVSESGSNLKIYWTNPSTATEFAVHIYTGAATIEDVKKIFELEKPAFSPITPSEILNRALVSNKKVHFFAIRLKDAIGKESGLSNIVVFLPKDNDSLPVTCFGCPNDTVLGDYSTYPIPFPDINIETLEGKAAVELSRRGVISGYPDGEFKGSNKVNRAEAAKMLLIAKFNSVGEIANSSKFPDVVADAWYGKFVITAANKGIISGYPDGSFKPGNTVNTAEFLKMLNLTFGMELNLPYSYADVKSNDWFAQYAGAAKKYKLFPNRVQDLLPAYSITRGDLAVAIYQYLDSRD